MLRCVPVARNLSFVARLEFLVDKYFPQLKVQPSDVEGVPDAAAAAASQDDDSSQGADT